MRLKNEFQRMGMEESDEYSDMSKKPGDRKLRLLLLLSAVTLLIMMVMSFVVFYQQKKFADLAHSIGSQNYSLSMGRELEKNSAEFKNLVSSLKVTLSSSITNNQLNNEVQTKRLSDIETLIINLNSSLSSVSTKLETKLQDLDNHQESGHTKLNNVLQGLNGSVLELAARLQNTGVQTNKLSDIETLISNLSSSLSSVSTKLETKLQDLDSQKNILSEIKMSISQLSSSVNSLFSKIQNTDGQVMKLLSDLSDLKTKLENSNKTIPLCKSEWIRFQSKCYFFSRDFKTWDEARHFCRSENGMLVKVETEEEMKFVTVSYIEYWVGLTDETTEVWRWDDGSPFVRIADWWSEGQPDNWDGHGLGGGEDCGHLTAMGKLNDCNCSQKWRYICQI